MGWRFWKRERKMEEHRQLWGIIHQLSVTTRELRMATQTQVDALDAATKRLQASTDASVKATDALIAAGQSSGGVNADAAIQAATDQMTSTADQLDAETAKANAAAGTDGTSGAAPVVGTEQARRVQLEQSSQA